MSDPSPEKLAEWRAKASKKQAIVPAYFVVYPTKVELTCGRCKTEFVRNLIPNRDEPVFICPNESCKSRNWVPVVFDLKTNRMGRYGSMS
jgi:hypothetical protein